MPKKNKMSVKITTPPGYLIENLCLSKERIYFNVKLIEKLKRQIMKRFHKLLFIVDNFDERYISMNFFLAFFS